MAHATAAVEPDFYKIIDYYMYMIWLQNLYLVSYDFSSKITTSFGEQNPMIFLLINIMGSS